MIFRENGQYAATYAQDMRIFRLLEDRVAVAVLLVVAFVVVPLVASDYWLSSILTLFLIFSLAALGLNLLTGYCGQLSLGHAAFMAVGAYAAFNFAVRLETPVLFNFIGAGLVTAAAGFVFALPSLRIKGFYLAVTTLSAQFFIEWLFVSFSWFSAGSMMGAIDTPPMRILGWAVETPRDKYLLTLGVVTVLALLAKNLTRGEIGRSWMAIRDLDVAAEIMGVRLFPYKLLAFAVSSFYAGVAGALYAFCYLGSVEVTAFELALSFRLLGMVIIGGLGTIMGSFLGAGFIVLLPIFISITVAAFATRGLTDFLSNLELIVFGGLIIFFLIVEPYGLARLWHTTKEKLRLWPFPY